ncbi:MAG: PIN domain-containing protein [Candidatus Bathyarchaeota archaeon]
MGPRVVLDTNVLLKVYNREPGYEGVVEILDQVESGKARAAISTVTIAEVAVGYHTSGDETGLKDFVLHFRSTGEYAIVDVDTGLAELAGKIRAKTGMRLPDAIIAASGVISGASHVITEDKQFTKASAFIASLTPDEFLKVLG